MKREKRELTLGQLETKEKIAKKIVKILVIVFEIFTVVYLVTACICVIERFHSKTILLGGILVLLFLVIVVSITCKVLEKIKNQITLKKDRMKVKVLKKLAEECGGNIKAFVSLKNEKVIADILSNNIVRITIDFIQDKNFVTTIQCADDTFRSGIRIPIEEFMSMLDEDSKKIMLNDSIKNIRLENSVGDTKEIVITGKTYVYKEDVSDDELLEMFELKE